MIAYSKISKGFIVSEDVSVEGSAARAADRGGDQLGFPDEKKPLLGSVPVIKNLVKEFGAGIVDIRKNYNLDKLTSAESTDAITALSKEYGNIIMGRDDRYFGSSFYDPGWLGKIITKRIPVVDGVTDAGELLFLTFATSLMVTASKLESESITDNEAEALVKHLSQEMFELLLWGHTL